MPPIAGHRGGVLLEEAAVELNVSSVQVGLFELIEITQGRDSTWQLHEHLRRVRGHTPSGRIVIDDQSGRNQGGILDFGLPILDWWTPQIQNPQSKIQNSTCILKISLYYTY